MRFDLMNTAQFAKIIRLTATDARNLMVSVQPLCMRYVKKGVKKFSIYGAIIKKMLPCAPDAVTFALTSMKRRSDAFAIWIYGERRRFFIL